MPLTLPHSLHLQLYSTLVAALARQSHSLVLSLSPGPSTPSYALVLESSSRLLYSASNFSNGGMPPTLQGSYPAKPPKASISPLLSSPAFTPLYQTCPWSRLDKSHKPPTSNPSKIPSPSPLLLHRAISSPHPTPQSITPTQKKCHPPLSASSHLPVLTVPFPLPSTSSPCPICMHAIQTPTSAQTGYVFCYKCIFKWVEGSHQRQLAFMDGAEEGWGYDDKDNNKNNQIEEDEEE